MNYIFNKHNNFAFNIIGVVRFELTRPQIKSLVLYLISFTPLCIPCVSMLQDFVVHLFLLKYLSGLWTTAIFIQESNLCLI